MNLLELTVNQLKRAAAIKEQIEGLSKELASILGASAGSNDGSHKTRRISYSGRKNIAAAQKARWAKLRAVKAAPLSGNARAKPKKKTMSRTTKAKLSAKLKAYWAAKRAGKK